MLLVVPREELLAVHARRLDRGEPAGEVGPVLQRLELRLAERVVVGDVRSRMRLGDAEIGEQECHRFGGHRLAAVSVDGQLLTANCLLGAGLADQHIGQRGGFAAGDHPADDVAGIDVQDHVKVVVGPFRWAEQLSYVPRPHLIRPVGDEFGFHLRGMGGLGAALTHLARLAQQPIEGRLRAEGDTFVEQRGPHLGRGHVDEPVAVQHVEDRLLLLGAQGTRLRPFAVRDRRRPLRCRADAVPPVVAGLRRAYGDARIPHADAPGEFGDGPVAHGVDLGSVSALSESVPKSACSFACTSTTKRALASSRSNWRFSASRRAIFSACGSRRLRPRGTANPASAPASRALRHSTIWLEYKPSRRNNAPFVPSGAASYSAKIANLYLAVNVRRFALSGTSGSGRSVPASSTRPGSTTPGARSNALTLLVIRESLHPRPRVTNCQWAGASGELGREGTSPNAEDPLTPATTSPLAALFRCTTPKTVPLCQYYAPVGAWFCNGQYIVAVIDELRFHVFLYLRMWRACASSSVPICSAVSALIGTVTDLPLAGLRRMPTSPRRVSSRKSIESGSMVIVSFGSCFVGRQLVGRSLRLKA